MDNREFAQVLLSEATELLAESAGANGVARRYRDARYENMKKEISKLRAKANDGKLTKEEERKLNNLMHNLDYVNQGKTFKEAENDLSQPESKFFGEAFARKASPASINHGNIMIGKNAAAYSKQIASGKSTKDDDVPGLKPSSFRKYDGVEKYDRSDRKVNPIHKKIEENAKRAEAKKSQNESIDLAILLTEAALLLNEE